MDIKEKLELHTALMNDISEIIGYGDSILDSGIDKCENNWDITHDDTLLIETEKGTDYWEFIISSYSSKGDKLYIGDQDGLVFIMGYDEQDGYSNASIFILDTDKRKFIEKIW